MLFFWMEGYIGFGPPPTPGSTEDRKSEIPNVRSNGQIL